MAGTVEVSINLHISKTIWNRIHREQQAQLKARLQGNDRAWSEALDQIEAFLVSKVESEGVTCPWIIRRRLEQISERFLIMALKVKPQERVTR